MINTLKMSFKIDFNYAINSFIYNIKKVPILKNIISDKLYSKSSFKTFIRILAVICSTFKEIFFKSIYLFVIYYLSKFICPNNLNNCFIHIFFSFTIIGMFINTSILSTSRKKYINIILLNMDAKEFTLSYLMFSYVYNFIVNLILLFGVCFILNINYSIAFILSLFSLLSKGVGEGINLYFYNKYKSRILDNVSIYFTIVILGLLISLLPYLNIYFYSNIIFIVTLVFIVMFIINSIYLRRFKNYKLIYKKLNTINKVMNNDNNNNNIASLVSINEKDINISSKKLKNKTGYDLFNTIFFERHKHLLLRSSNIYTIISFLIFILVGIIIYEIPSYKLTFNNFLMNNMSSFFIIMYFINRGEVVTRAMFFNCDHSMLTFNFYRTPDVINGLFKRRLSTIIKINLRPALIISLGLSIILYLSGGTSLLINYVLIPIFIITLSIFFSVHYLVIYYLLQPYNKSLQLKSPMYSIISMGTYFICYYLIKFNYSTTILTIFSIIFTIIYIIISLILVNKKASYTFKLK